MKALIFVVCLCVVSVSFATETNTECQGMKEQNSRTNPKASLETKVKTQQQSKGSSVQ